VRVGCTADEGNKRAAALPKPLQGFRYELSVPSITAPRVVRLMKPEYVSIQRCMLAVLHNCGGGKMEIRRHDAGLCCARPPTPITLLGVDFLPPALSEDFALFEQPQNTSMVKTPMKEDTSRSLLVCGSHH
jgi:hypothetical protein